ncbi:UDP-Glycosyltransferase/glycogen phosphorylase [Delitschia confertaspora ATCC 74209]|uniref:UDP-Glycosyltransferase/glycogen phosphorylase n=1 Tax=Delitschia confertaspora ATCC 74209 TaxID=1513339 RepID=A0A9P4N105_9PLEO|nr:UDP-Glycosyltransferase/glycogen phosphorylase [Delitschia confertaspora ATCC 74209]
MSAQDSKEGSNTRAEAAPPSYPPPSPLGYSDVDTSDRLTASQSSSRMPHHEQSQSGRPPSYAPYEPSHTYTEASQTPGVGTHPNYSGAPASDSPNSNEPPPAYTELPGQIHNESSELGTNAVVADDGRVNIRIHQKSGKLSQIFNPQLRQQLSQVEQEPAPPPPYIPESLGGVPGKQPPPALNVVIHVVGSRGDVQPFVALGKVLKETYGHRVRLATHPTFKDFVTENGLEFFSIGGDPAELMAFMVKNPGLMPGFDTLRSGDVGKRRRGIAEILRGTWRSCIEPGDGLGVDPLKLGVEEWTGSENRSSEPASKSFIADAIIANPPSFGHIHIAEKLGIPLHMMFTMPWSPTQQFPHPLANIQSSNADPNITNYMSYTLVDMLTWQGLGDVINDFREGSLGLEPISMMWAPGLLARLKIPYTYCWSPALIPKPRDWGHHISIAGFYFLNLAQNFTPAPDLLAFLNAGEPPVYIGFGSIVVDDPNAMTQLIFDAVRKTGRRALVSKGWGGLGADELGVPQGVFMLGNVPHDWLFRQVSCVVHHGGAGTTAAGIATGKPTVVVPFFGDQAFWGAMTAKAGAGPPPIPYKDLTSDKLAEAIQEALKPESLERARELSQKISQEQGDHKGAQFFHQMLKIDNLRCAVIPKRPAVWRVRRTQTRLSAVAAVVLAQAGELSLNDLKLYRPREYETDDGPWDPVIGGATALIGTMTTMMMGVADFPTETLKLLNIHPDAKKGKGKEAVRRSETVTSGAASQSTSTPESAVVPPGSSSPRRSSSMETSNIEGPTRRPSSFLVPRKEVPSRSSSRDDIESNFSRSKSPSAVDNQPGSGARASNKTSNFRPEDVMPTAKGIARIIGAGFKSPMDFSLNVSKGFHNVPKLYGDEVRQVDKVTGFQSGVKTAAKELGLGFYEGITGLVMDPVRGAKKEGGVGFVKGVGKGIAGVPLRVMGGVFAVPGYAMKGLYQHALNGRGENIQKYIIAARISQGNDEATNLTARDKDDILSMWRGVKVNMKKKKNPGEEQIDALHTLLKEHRTKRRESFRKVLDGGFKRPEARPSFGPSMSNTSSYSNANDVPSTPGAASALRPPITGRQTHPLRAPTYDGSSSISLQNARSILAHPHPSQSAAQQQENTNEEAEARELEEAIRLSVSQSSHGDPTEAELLERAIQASIKELQRAPAGTYEDEEEALQRAMRASVEEVAKSGATEEEQRILEETLRESVLNTTCRRNSSDWDSDEEMWDDEELKRILAESKEWHQAQLRQEQETNTEQNVGAATEENDEEEFRRAMEESERAEEDRRKELERQRHEEEVVMEYVKKQSLAEEEHRRRLMQGRGDPRADGEGSDNPWAGGAGAGVDGK